MFRKKAPLIVLLIICCLQWISAEPELKKIAACTIKFGEIESSIGTLGPGSDSVKPLFFASMPDGTIAVPDHYNNRIAFFSREGNCLRSMQAESIVSPRMNYFASDKRGGFIAFGDSRLARIGSDGTIIWQAPFPLGLLPAAIVPTDSGVYFLIDSDGEKSSYHIPSEPPFIAKDSRSIIESRALPSLVASGHSYGFRFGDMETLRDNEGRWRSSGSIPDDAIFAAADARGRSIWRFDGARGNAIAVISESGGEIYSFSVPRSSEGSWLWIDVALDDDGLTLVVRDEAEESITYTTYRAAFK